MGPIRVRNRGISGIEVSACPRTPRHDVGREFSWLGGLEALQEYAVDDIAVEDIVEGWERLAGDDNGVQTGEEDAWVADEDDGVQTDEDHAWIAGDKAELGGDTSGAQGRERGVVRRSGSMGQHVAHSESVAGGYSQLTADAGCRSDHGEQCCAAEVQIRATEASLSSAASSLAPRICRVVSTHCTSTQEQMYRAPAVPP
ncbi:hypothetical protein GN244_ATG19144 [Phytophthora infestans]|uniref:Uncharacterized protein n=1 Tax=Phytophthora infestans TaxID=4787 RepID=A0A833SV97_PHYIN|nr:hypothetical protein GN244_ATG19144 [Phytophthora infestans]KAF4128528.1 hypothetical protein GN958_ATG22287 [Phytophthora infestans]